MEIKKYIILDTDYLSYFLIERPSAIVMVKSLLKKKLLPATTVITKAEMFYGANKKKVL